VSPEVSHNVLNLVSQGREEEDEDAKNDVRLHALSSFSKIIERPNVPDKLLQIAVWVILSIYRSID